MSVAIRCLVCLLLLAVASPVRAQSYGPNIGIAAAPLRAVPGQKATGVLNWWGRQSPIFSQTDPRWADRMMGQSGETIGQLGCFLSAAAMVRNLLGYGTTMRQMLALAGRDEDFRASGYVSADDILNRLFPGHAVRFVPRDGFADLHGGGRSLVLLRIDQTPEATVPAWHWVLLLGHKGADYLVLDPFDGGVRRLRDSAACAAEASTGRAWCAPVHGAYVITVAKAAAEQPS